MTTGGAPEAPTPAEAADLPDRVIKALLDNQTRVRKLFRRWLIFASLVLALGVGYNSWQAHDANVTAGQIRTSQIANTKTTDHHDQCNQTADHDIGFDLKAVVAPGQTPQQFLAEIKIPSAKC